ncbi:Methyltransferase domain-containing protein [Candidatus Electrothrix aarhusensis]|uniref:Methyltransferase domain-containing protein n=1 Tax=Candidatus Electrothrix aarhusensis TaxID=1859131 RepID=A0A444IRJ0_9BACT|nr:Methyltransferase domain-containing protein [Candidatus Electrothrix aarhusensis]
MEHHKKYLKLADTIINLQGRNVLEVGGCSPIDLILNYKPNCWTCVDLNAKAVSLFNENVRKRKIAKYSANLIDISKFDTQEKYDLIYSINSFEHIHDLEKTLKKMYLALRPEGYLFTVFGPIWSSDVGHHLSISTENEQTLNFQQGILSPWEHLISTPKDLKTRLEQEYGSETAQKAVTYIYEYKDLNRLYEHEYFSIIKNSQFSKILSIKKRKGIAPKMDGVTNTRELMFILKKGDSHLLEKSMMLLKLVGACLTQRIYKLKGI